MFFMWRHENHLCFFFFFLGKATPHGGEFVLWEHVGWKVAEDEPGVDFSLISTWWVHTVFNTIYRVLYIELLVQMNELVTESI